MNNKDNFGVWDEMFNSYKHRNTHDYASRERYTNLLRESLYSYYANINMQIFKWKGLPDTCSVFYLEKSLISTGRACMFKDSITNTLYTLGWNQGGTLNIYGEYENGIAIGGNGSTFQGSSWTQTSDIAGEIPDMIPCFDTKNRTPLRSLIDIMVDKLTSLFRTQDVLIAQSKRSFIITCPASMTQNVKNMLSDMNNDATYIVGNEAIASIVEGVNVLPLPNTLDNIDKVTQEIITIDNLIRKYLGVYNNENNTKKERLVVDEINSNNNITDIMLYNRLESRREFCERVNRLYGLNISVDLSDNIKNEEEGEINDKDISSMENNE